MMRQIRTNIAMGALTCAHCGTEIEYRDKFIETPRGRFCTELCEAEAGGDPLAETAAPTYRDETLTIAHERAAEIAKQFEEEVARLLRSGGVDPENHSRGMLFGVALENIADGYLRGERATKSYKNMQRF
jgi:hypothetical protein